MSRIKMHLRDARAWGTLVAILLGLSLTVSLFLWAFRVPSDGIIGYLEAEGYRVERAFLTKDALRADDLIVAVDGYPLSRGLNCPGVWKQRLDLRSSKGATYTLRRAGEVLTQDLVWQPMTPREVATRVGPHLCIALVFFGSLIATFFVRVPERVLPLVVVGAWVQGMNALVSAGSHLGANVSLAYAWLWGPSMLFTSALAGSAFTHVLLIYPERKSWISPHPWIPLMLHGLNVAVALLAWVAPGPGSLLEGRTWMVRHLLLPVIAVELAVGTGGLVHTYISSQKPGVREQVRWLVWGMVLGPAVWLLFYNLPFVFLGEPLVPLWVADLPLVLTVLAFVFSMSRRGLMWADLCINRTLVYGVLGGVLVTVFFLVTGALVRSEVMTTRNADLVGVLVLAGLAPVLHTTIQKGVNRLFFRRWLSTQALFRDVSKELSTTLRREGLTRILVEEVPERLHVMQVALFLQQEDGSLKAMDDSSGWPIPADHPVLQELAQFRAPLILSQARQLSPILQSLRDENWEIILPLRSGEALVGLYLLGTHRGGELYGQNEIETLRLLGERIALTLENARLYEEIERYSENLEALVRSRTRDLEEVNRALSAQRDRLQVILQNIADGLVYITDEGRIALVNAAFETLMGRSMANLVDKPLLEAGVPPTVISLVEQAQADPGMVLTGDSNLSDRIVRLSAVGLAENGGVIAVVRDITREVEVDRMKSKFFSSVSHELRTPLTSILGFSKVTRHFVADRLGSQLVESERARSTVDRIDRNLDIISTEGQRLMALINDVLDITALDAGTVQWNDRPCSLSTLIQDAIESQREAAEAKGLILRARMARDLPTMFVDPDRLLQVLRNLLSNAVKFTEEGSIQVSAHWMEPGEEVEDWTVPSSGAVLIAVRDTGVGLGDEQAPRVFERFSQVETLLDSQPVGTGLGLAICQEIVSHYGGIIWVESEPGRGSVFSFTLPARREVEPVRG